ncbi:MAG: sigma-54-dependent Fis family transcriptional regulator [Clostridiaceae bacterium]|jgi:PAS domain S-box-containing protein|nr:sigma-54-dependent Fis family transcriptional regulator [Clostridiaceae bacterium]
MSVLDNHNDIISRSHKRCIDYKIEKERVFPTRTFYGKEFYGIINENRQIIKIARPFMEILYDFLKGSGFSLYLTESEGIVLTMIGDKDILYDLDKMGIAIGADMSEKSTGTNAIGTSLAEDCSVQISGTEHFINVYHIWTCSASTIHNEQGDIIGCLNLTGRYQLAHPHTLGLVVAAVKSIENQLNREKIQGQLFETYQYLNRIMNSINLGIFATDINGIVTSINNSACSMLDIDEKDIINRNIESILNDCEYIFNIIKLGKDYENKEIAYSTVKSKKRFNLSVYPIRNKQNEIIGIVGIFKDIQNIYNLVNKYTSMRATYTFDDIIGKSDKILEIKEQAIGVANSPSTVLIQGESGTGKEIIAQSIHNRSSRRNDGFVAINCGAIPKNLIESELFGYEDGAFTGAKHGGQPGKFEIANGGTLFLDEIGEMPLDMQVNLLRVLQEGYITRVGGSKYIKVDVRIIASTNKNLKEEVEKGNFREDLYYRLSVIPINIPPLREREGDIDILIEHFLKTKAAKLGKPLPKISHELYEKLINYSWPGNVREMENCVENIVNLNGKTTFVFNGNNITNENIKTNNNFQYEIGSLDDLEINAIMLCIDNCNGNISKAAKILGINRSTIYTKLRKHNININLTVY